MEKNSEKSFTSLSKQSSLSGEKNSISAIIACYKDNQAIPIMYERLVDTFERNNIDYEIIFVNDCSQTILMILSKIFHQKIKSHWHHSLKKFRFSSSFSQWYGNF